jgi:hypothetical protein
MATFSINVGTTTQTSGYELGGTSSDLNGIIFSNLHDNQTFDITPEMVRDALFSLNVSYPFKETSVSGQSYIGIDTQNPNNRDLKKKLYFGKRAFSGTFSYTDPQTFNIMDSTLLSSDVDIFLYNTKSDVVSNDITKILIISGTGVSTFDQSPYIQSEVVTGLTQNVTSLDFVNSNTISVKSDYGTVSINGIPLPTNTPSNLSTIIWTGVTGPTASTQYQPISFPPLSQVGGFLGITGSATHFFGNSVYVNNYPLEFTDSRRVPIDLNDIDYGINFQNYPISELVKKIVFPYLGPEVEISLDTPFGGGYAEVGTYPVPNVKWKIKKRTYPTQITTLSNMIPGAYPPITPIGEQTVFGNSIGIVISPITSTATEFKITATDGTQSASASTYLTGIYPYFVGWSNLPTMTNTGLGSLTKGLSFQGDKVLDLYGTGNYFYYVYDGDWGTLSAIVDNTGFTCSASFSQTGALFSSPTGLWAGKNYIIYQWSNPPQFVNPTLFQFLF